MTAPEHMYLIIFSRSSGESTIEDLGTDPSSAVATFAAREHALVDRDEVDVILIGSPSLQVLRSTHSSYFSDADGLAAILAPFGR